MLTRCVSEPYEQAWMCIFILAIITEVWRMCSEWTRIISLQIRMQTSSVACSSHGRRQNGQVGEESGKHTHTHTHALSVFNVQSLCGDRDAIWLNALWRERPVARGDTPAVWRQGDTVSALKEQKVQQDNREQSDLSHAGSPNPLSCA